METKEQITREEQPLILITNDDGIRAEGLGQLTRELRAFGRVLVVAPDAQRSATSHSITLHRPLRVEQLSRTHYAVDGTPTDCIMLAVHEILQEKPDLIVSGINHGANLGDDVHYSGTVSAAFEGGILGIPSLAISRAGDSPKRFSAAAKVAGKIVVKVLDEGLKPGIILNVNIPDLPLDEIKGLRITKQGKRNYGGIIVEKVDPRGKKYYWIGGDDSGLVDIAGSDCNAIRDGYVSITPLRVNLTDQAALSALSRWQMTW